MAANFLFFVIKNVSDSFAPFEIIISSISLVAPSPLSLIIALSPYLAAYSAVFSNMIVILPATVSNWEIPRSVQTFSLEPTTAYVVSLIMTLNCLVLLPSFSKLPAYLINLSEERIASRPFASLEAFTIFASATTGINEPAVVVTSNKHHQLTHPSSRQLPIVTNLIASIPTSVVKYSSGKIIGPDIIGVIFQPFPFPLFSLDEF